MPVKTDQNDTQAMGQVVRTGWYKAVHMKSELYRELRALLTGRKLLVANFRGFDNATLATPPELPSEVPR